MNDSILGIVITFLVVGIILSVGVGLQGGVDIPISYEYNPNGAQTKSIEQIKADNMAENLDALKNYCEALDINCG